MRRLLLLVLISLPCASWAADEQRLSFLEQEVRNLQRQVQTLSRQLDELRTRPDRPTSPAAAPRANAPAPDPARWLDASRWKQLRPGRCGTAS